MRRPACIAAVILAAGLAGCNTGTDGATASRPRAPVTARGAPVAPSVVPSGCSTWMTAPETVAALVHIRTTLRVSHALAPQAGVRGLVTVSSIDVAFFSAGARVGWASQAKPPADATTVMGNGMTELTAVAYNIYLSGRWAPDCRVLRVYWLPGDHS